MNRVSVNFYRAKMTSGVFVLVLELTLAFIQFMDIFLSRKGKSSYMFMLWKIFIDQIFSF